MLITIFSQYIEILIQWIVRVFCLLCGAVVVVAAVVVVVVAGAVVAVVVGRGVVATSDWWIVYWLTSLSQQLIVLYIILIVLYIIYSMSIRFVVFYSFSTPNARTGVRLSNSWCNLNFWNNRRFFQCKQSAIINNKNNLLV